MTHNGEIIVIVDGERMTLDEFTKRKQARVNRLLRRMWIPLVIVAEVAIFVTLVACEPEKQRQRPYEEALITHHCTKEQMERVEREAAFCNKSTSFLSTYCYGSAIIRNCTPKEAIY